MPFFTTRLVSYHDAGVSLVVVGGMHALEPLLACCIPEVCNMNTTLSAQWGWGVGGQRPPTCPRHFHAGLYAETCKHWERCVCTGGVGRHGTRRTVQTAAPEGRKEVPFVLTLKTRGPSKLKFPDGGHSGVA